MALTKEALQLSVKEHNGVYPSDITYETLQEAGLLPYVALIPKDHNERIRYFGDMLVQLCFRQKSADPKLKMELIDLATALSYLINSTSFASDEYKDFDRAEINRKLRREADDA